VLFLILLLLLLLMFDVVDAVAVAVVDSTSESLRPGLTHFLCFHRDNDIG